jgi:hypothetical protein
VFVLTVEHTDLQEKDLPLMFNRIWMRISVKPAEDFSSIQLVREKRSFVQIVVVWIGGKPIQIR